MVLNGVLFVICFLVEGCGFFYPELVFFLKSLPTSKVDCFHVLSSRYANISPVLGLAMPVFEVW